MTELRHKDIESPLGLLRLIASREALVGIHFSDEAGARGPELARPRDDHPSRRLLDRATSELAEYFAGERRRFTLPLAPEGTEFQRVVWAALRELEFGRTCSYAELARAIGRPSSVRAVGAANGRNPLPIVVPCHRVIGSDGSLTGYAGGLERKRWLLAHEGAQLPLL